MKRSAALQPLSREHHAALVLAKACLRAAQSGDDETIRRTCQRAYRAFADELEPHFLVEERTLLPLLPAVHALVQRTLADHSRLRALLDGLRQDDAAALGEFGERLAAHVRFEERELFPSIENLPDAAPERSARRADMPH